MRRRILLLVVGMTTLVVLAFAIPLAVLIRHTVYADALTSLRTDTSKIGLYLRSADAAKTSDDITSYLASISDGRRVSVQLPDGSVLGTSPPGDVAELPDASGGSGEPDGGPGFGGRGGPPDAALVSWQGGRLSQLVVPEPSFRGGFYVVRVFASDGELHSGENGWWLLLSGAALALLAIGVLAGEVMTRRIVRPLVETAATAQQLSAGDTTARAPTDGPGEVADVGHALNRLADRIDELIAEERETVADLSHRLRTPLTALRLDAEALRDPTEAERVGGHVSALERMLTAVIHAARRPQREGRMPSCDASAVVAERVAFWSALADDQNRACTLTRPPAPLLVRAGAEDLAAALDALLENVIAHTPEGTAFAVSLTPTPTGARLEISDDGPGLPRSEPVRGRSDRGSSGLGLDIARRCAESAGGAMHLGSSATGGAAIVLDLGAP
ncbi:MAG TPA: HAMP domain-containing sensor histidine kinase [Jatrophihabitans sp.]|uniref:HAMP domain-containing sensor histidine kinase n=1 Tax=Jatrophihabitans sp. TaxID=1932789 RepID=UPI002E048BDE|nr:HAMP domain-containing sensor histidine kinase [Jatrophihabitans sp.]